MTKTFKKRAVTRSPKAGCDGEPSHERSIPHTAVGFNLGVFSYVQEGFQRQEAHQAAQARLCCGDRETSHFSGEAVETSFTPARSQVGLRSPSSVHDFGVLALFVF